LCWPCSYNVDMTNTQTIPSPRTQAIAAMDAKIAAGEKFAPHEVTSELHRIAVNYVEHYSGDFSYLVSMTDRLANGYAINANQAKGILNCLLAERRRNQRSTEPAPEGIHLFQNEVYKVQANKAGTATYAKKRVGSRWEYVGQVASLSPATLLTLAQAKAIGHETGHCVMCGRELTVPESVAAGIGPVCAKKF